MSKRATCQLCGERFDSMRDERRWRIVATSAPPLSGKTVQKRMIVCTDCFLETAEPEFGA